MKKFIALALSVLALVSTFTTAVFAADVPFLRETSYEEDSSYVIYGETVECELLHVADDATIVEILSDVESETYLTEEAVSELFFEEFGYKVRVSERETYFPYFLIEDTYSAKEYVVPTKEEGLPYEVWEGFVDEFGEGFFETINNVVFLDKDQVAKKFEMLLGYAPEVEVFHWTENDVTFDITFDHLDGKTFCLEAAFSIEDGEWFLTEQALRAFCEEHPETTVAPCFTWKQLLKLVELYYNR